ncbi:TIGR00282 family metallophosphoesterase [Paenibacillus sp. FSL W8-1187]|uniref:Phosphoesterase n=1 Tax=Paenibacillus pasadenensis TaxID=217090 RepID=A0A2N5N726_9BACL|nr:MULTISPECIES: TIGR00282 family metallophosphoesterase [Paenibacillus]PLT46123.1 Phosphoesterase [Paenibacillus pasadenensis]QGG56590.1 TIGR00282 family metallophosphoesterase [Paenibacillus sp. B01]
MKVLFIGDIVGNVGRAALRKALPALRAKHNPDIIIVNGENAAAGRGITAAIAKEFFDWGVNGITMGNHTWDNKDLFDWIDDEPRLVRPANFSSESPGIGSTVIKAGSKKLGILNVQGRTFLPPNDCPFKTADAHLERLKRETSCVLVDFHAEATSEKIAMGWYLDGRASVVLGTHTHVQTNDDRILPQGTAFLTDVGMTGPMDGILGMDRDAVLHRFLTGLPSRFVVAEGDWHLHGVLAVLDEATGRAQRLEKIRLTETSLAMF